MVNTMKKNARKWAIALILTLIFAFDGVGVFAADGAAAAPAAPVVSAFAGALQTADPEAGTVSLYWAPDPNAVRYEVYVDGELKGTVTNADLKALPASAGGGAQVYFMALGLNEYAQHTFLVRAYNAAGAFADGVVGKQPVRPINYVLTMKKKVTLKSHGGPAQTITLSKGEKVYAYGFSSGKYVFKRNGSIFYVAKSRGKKISSDYTRDWDYTPADAENYVNTASVTSNSGTLIWVSTYCQHIYYFVGGPGNWTCIKDWECSTGKATSPSPTGKWGFKEIGKKIKRRHGIKWWSTYSSMNAFHGKLKSWKLGAPKSGGCIRNEVPNAQFIFNNAAKTTRVLIG